MSLDIANTVLNASPYFDDYNEDKRFHRILFRPTVAVQARELNQVQSIFQNQIERFGQHIFKDGSIIKGCGLSYLTDIEYVSIADQFDQNTSLSSTNTNFVNAIAVGNTSGVVAQIISAREGFSATSTPARFFIRYTQPGANNERTFIENERINLYQPGKSYIDKVILKITSASTANSANFPNGARLINATTRARGFITNAYANGSGSYVELRNVRKTFANNDVVYLSTDESITATINAIDYIAYANSFIDSVRVLANSAGSYTSTGYAYGVAVSPGIVFHKGHFIKVDNHITIVNEDTSNPEGKILYFNTTEEVIDEVDDNSLYDNASGTPNINAPGARRLKLTSNLISRNKSGANTITESDIAFPIVEFGASGPVFQRTNAQYNLLGDELARRTYEEAGHFIIKPFGLSTRNNSDPESLVYDVTQGTAYVKGQKVELLNTLGVIGRRGTDTVSISEGITSINYGQYVIVDEMRGYFPVDQSITVALYNAAQDAVSTERMPGEAPTGSIIGYANLRAIKYIESSTVAKGDPTSQYRFYLFNFRYTGSSTFSAVRSIVYNDGSNNVAFADCVLESSKAVLKETTVSPLIFGLNAKAVKDLRAANGVYNPNYYYIGANTTEQLTTAGTITFGVGAAKGILGFSDNTNASELFIDIIVTGDNTATDALSGTVTTSGSCTTITGSSTTFTSDFLPGEYIEFIGAGVSSRVVSITDATTMVVSPARNISSANTYRRVHINGSVIPLNPAAGSKRTITVAENGESCTIDMGDTYTGDQSVAVRYYARNNEANHLKKEINRDCLVVIDTSNNVAGSTGPWSLGVPDVTRLTGVFFGTNTSNFSLYVNSVDQFDLDPGQRDTMYDHALLSLKPKSTVGSLANTYMLVRFDCFTANATGGEGFFCVESYPVDDTATANGEATIRTWQIPTYTSVSTNTSYDLRDSIDFRPYKSNTANVTNLFADLTVNPPLTNTFNSNTTNYNPFPGSALDTNITYYIPRKDRLVVTSDGVFRVEEGLPGKNPRYPQVSPDVLVIADIDIPSYPSLTDDEKFATNRSDHQITYSLLSHKRFTMKDISILEQRIQRLEYYTTLNMLEKVALQTSVADDSGVERFRNGFFVDPFNSHVYGATSDPQYRVAIDERAGLLRAPIHPEFVQMEFDTDTRSYSNVAITGNMVSLTYDHELYIDQPYASDVVNVSGTPIKWSGTIDARPLKSSEIEATIAPLSVSNSSRSIQAYGELTSIAPGMANYGWWREDPVAIDDYKILKSEQEIRDQTSVPVESSKTISSPEGNIQASNITYFAKERIYGFKAVGLKPNVVHNIYINDIDISPNAALGEVQNPNDGEHTFVERTSVWGTPLQSDSRGEIVGKFYTGTATLPTGTHKLTLSSRRNTDSDLEESVAIAYFVIDAAAGKIITPPIVFPPPPPPPPPPSANTPANTSIDSNGLNRDLPYEVRAGYITTGDYFIQYGDEGYGGDVTYAEFTFDARFMKANNVIINNYKFDFNKDSQIEAFDSATNTSLALIDQATYYNSPGPHKIKYKLPVGVTSFGHSLQLTVTYPDRPKRQGDVGVEIANYSTKVTVAPPPPIIQTSNGSVSAGLLATNLKVSLLPTLYNDLSDYRHYIEWNTEASSPSVKNALKLPLLGWQSSGVQLGNNNDSIKLVAKSNYQIAGEFEWQWEPIDGTTYPNYSFANITAVYVTSGGTGYSNNDTIRFSNGYIDALATIQTNSSGGIVAVNVVSEGDFTNATPVTSSTYVANSTANNNFTLTTSSTNTSIQVAIDGLLQVPGTDYQVSGGTTLILSSNAAVGETVYVNYGIQPSSSWIGGTSLVGYSDETWPGWYPTNKSFIGVDNISVFVSNDSVYANSTTGNTSGGSAAVFDIVTGMVTVSSSATPLINNDVFVWRYPLLNKGISSTTSSAIRVKVAFKETTTGLYFGNTSVLLTANVSAAATARIVTGLLSYSDDSYNKGVFYLNLGDKVAINYDTRRRAELSYDEEEQYYFG